MLFLVFVVLAAFRTINKYDLYIFYIFLTNQWVHRFHIQPTPAALDWRAFFFFFYSPALPPQHATIVPRSRYLPGFLHPVELDRDLGEGRSLVGPVPPALPHQLITGRGEGRTRWRLMPQGTISQQRQDRKADYLHLIVTVFGFLHPVALGQFFIELGTRHATVWCATWGKKINKCCHK